MNTAFKKMTDLQGSIKNVADYRNQKMWTLCQEALATAESAEQTIAITALHKQIVNKALDWHFNEAKRASAKPDITEQDQGWMEEQVGIINDLAKKAGIDVKARVEAMRKAALKTK